MGIQDATPQKAQNQGQPGSSQRPSASVEVEDAVAATALASLHGSQCSRCRSGLTSGRNLEENHAEEDFAADEEAAKFMMGYRIVKACGVGHFHTVAQSGVNCA